MRQITWGDFDTVVTDLDGTLLNHNREISAKTKEALQLLHNKGKRIFIATGRPWYFAKTEAKYVNSTQVVSCNGSMIYDYKRREPLLLNPLDPRIAEQIFHFLIRHHATFVVYGTEEMLAYSTSPDTSKWFNWLLQQNEIKEHDERFHVSIVDYDQTIDFQVMPILEYIVILDETPHDSVAKIWEFLREQHTVYPVQSQSNVLDIMPRDVTKGTALLELENQGFLDLKRTLVFGDQYNDISMFEQARFSVAMGNSRDYIKSQATFTTLPNSEEGFHHFFTGQLIDSNEPSVFEEPVDTHASDPSHEIDNNSSEECDTKSDVYTEEDLYRRVSDISDQMHDVVTQTREVIDAARDELQNYGELQRSLGKNLVDFTRQALADESEEIQEEESGDIDFDSLERDFEDSRGDDYFMDETTNDDSYDSIDAIETDSEQDYHERLYRLNKRFANQLGVCPLDQFSYIIEDINTQLDNDELKTSTLIMNLERLEIAFDDLEINMYTLEGCKSSEVSRVVQQFTDVYNKLSPTLDSDLNTSWSQLLSSMESYLQSLRGNNVQSEVELVRLQEELRNNRLLIESQERLIHSLKSQVRVLHATNDFFKKYRHGQLSKSDYAHLEETILSTEDIDVSELPTTEEMSK